MNTENTTFRQKLTDLIEDHISGIHKDSDLDAIRENLAGDVWELIMKEDLKSTSLLVGILDNI